MMIIHDKRESRPSRVNVGDLGTGDGFEFDGEFYMNLDERYGDNQRTVRMASGVIVYFPLNEPVTRVGMEASIYRED